MQLIFFSADKSYVDSKNDEYVKTEDIDPGTGEDFEDIGPGGDIEAKADDYEKFQELRLWFDRNRNGRSESSEIEKLEKYGISDIYLTYVRPGGGPKAERKVLNSVYFNDLRGKYYNVEDHYFYEYVNGERVSIE